MPYMVDPRVKVLNSKLLAAKLHVLLVNKDVSSIRFGLKCKISSVLSLLQLPVNRDGLDDDVKEFKLGTLEPTDTE